MGACRTAFDADLARVNLTEQCDLRGAGGALDDAEKVVVNDNVNLTEQCEILPAKKLKALSGRGDTATTGKHSRRYKAYLRSVKKGELKPSQYALVRHVHLGEKIGTETAQIWLEAMREEGVLREVVKRGKRAYELIT